MENVYLDNGATSFPKAPGVVESMTNYILKVGTNVGRGAYDLSYQAEDVVYETRELICELFNFPKAENVIFTKNITESLNVLIKGCLQAGDHVIVSSMEHNAVMRPLNSLGNKIEYTKVTCNQLGDIQAADVEAAIKPHTKAVVMTHASNVCGTILDLEMIGEICNKHHLWFIIDSAQTAGFLDIDFQKLKADALGFTGHKGLLGPQGIGGFIISDRLAEQVSPLMEGGTGSLSDEEIQPAYMPDKFEAGTLNIPGIYGLNASLKYLLQKGVENIRQEEIYLTQFFIERLLDIDGLQLVGKKDTNNRTAIISMVFPERDQGIIAHDLSRKYHIMSRNGLHCAPSAHKTLGTFPEGTVRFSLSHFTTMEEISYAVDCLDSLLK